jgi:hypothetical protein
MDRATGYMRSTFQHVPPDKTGATTGTAPTFLYTIAALFTGNHKCAYRFGQVVRNA